MRKFDYFVKGTGWDNVVGRKQEFNMVLTLDVRLQGKNYEQTVKEVRELPELDHLRNIAIMDISFLHSSEIEE